MSGKTLILIFFCLNMLIDAKINLITVDDSFSQVFSKVFDEIYIKNDIKALDILIFDKSKQFDDIANDIGRFDQMSVKVSYINNINKWNMKLEQSAVMLGSDKNLNKIVLNAVLSNEFSKSLRFLIYTKNLGNFFFRRSLIDKAGKVDQFMYILLEKRGVFALSTIDWFSDIKCNLNSNKIIKAFNKSSKVWLRDQKIEKKFSNFHECPLTLQLYSHQPKFDEFDNTYKGYMLDIFKIMAQKTNFTALYQPTDYLTHKPIPTNGKILYPNVIFEPAVMNFLYSNSYHISTTYGQRILGFIITPGDLYTSYEKLYLPFDNDTWMYIGITFLLAFFVISIANRLPKAIQNMIYGDGIKTPTFNVIAIFFGIGQVRLPSANFPRINLMMFILFCLIIRTAYQSVLFEFMTSEMRRKPIETLQDLRDENFSIYCLTRGVYCHMAHDLLPSIDRSMIKPCDDYEPLQLCNDLLNSSLKMAYLVDDIGYEGTCSVCQENLLKLRENLLILPSGIAILKNHFLFDALEEVMQLIIPSGIPQHAYDDFVQLQWKFKGSGSEKGPQILTVDDLSFGFIIWLGACAVSAVFFMIEVIYWCLMRTFWRTKPDNQQKMDEKIDKVKYAKIHPEIDGAGSTSCTCKDPKIFKIHQKNQAELEEVNLEILPETQQIS